MIQNNAMKAESASGPSRLAIRRLCIRHSCGQAAIEFALTVPILAIMFSFAFDLGRMANLKSRLEMAAYEGVKLTSTVVIPFQEVLCEPAGNNDGDHKGNCGKGEGQGKAEGCNDNKENGKGNGNQPVPEYSTFDVQALASSASKGNDDKTLCGASIERAVRILEGSGVPTNVQDFKLSYGIKTSEKILPNNPVNFLVFMKLEYPYTFFLGKMLGFKTVNLEAERETRYVTGVSVGANEPPQVPTPCTKRYGDTFSWKGAQYRPSCG